MIGLVKSVTWLWVMVIYEQQIDSVFHNCSQLHESLNINIQLMRQPGIEPEWANLFKMDSN